MKKTAKSLKSLFLVLTVLVVGFVPAVLLAEHDSDRHHDKNERGAGLHHEGSENPLMEEMIKLDKVFREVVSGVAMGDGQRVHHALEAMHGTMEKTHEGVHKGHVSIPRNAHRLEEFVKMDKDFHERLETLAHAAHEGDQEKMLSITKTLLDGCVQCHRIYR